MTAQDQSDEFRRLAVKLARRAIESSVSDATLSAMIALLDDK